MWRCLVVVVALVACKESSKSQPPPTTPVTTPVPDTKTDDGFALETSHGRTVLAHGKAYVEGGALEIRISDVPGPCGSGFKPPWQAVAFIRVPPGPDRRYFAGAPFGTKVSAGDIGGTFSAYGPEGVRVTLEPFTLRAGETIRGTLALMSGGGGAFSAEVCPGDDATLAALPGTAPAAPATGAIAGKPFAVKRALITVDKQSETYRAVGALVLLSADASCEEIRDHMIAYRGAPAISISEIGGASSQVALTGSPQPADFYVRPGSEDSGAAWVQLDEIVLEPGKRLHGKLALANAARSTAVAGTFEAEVCP